MSSLKDKAVNGLIWSFIDSFAGQGISIFVGIMLARILSPREFGLIGMIVVFIAVSESFINSGFTSALIRKKECTEADYSTVFFFNLIAGVLFFIVLFLSAPAIGGYFNEPELVPIVQVLGVVLIIDALTMIQRTILTKRLDFKLQARISVIASIGSGGVALAMAYAGMGVWSLIALRLVKQGLNSFFLWIWNKWRPALIFSWESFRELFGFGSKLLVSGLIDTIYQNIYYLIIGKYFSAQDLGFYTRADEFKKIPSQNMTSIISRVSYPLLSSIQDDPERLKATYQKLIRSTMFVTFILMMGMAAVAEPMVITLVGEKWRESIVYLQLLCFVGMMYPLHALNLNMLQVQGRSDLFLRLEIIKKLLAVPVIVVGILWGIKAMIYGMIINTMIAYYLNSYWSGKMIGYSFFNQIRDIIPSFSLAVCMAVSVLLSGSFLNFNLILTLMFQLFFGAIFVVIISEMFGFKDYLFIKSLVNEKIFNIKNYNMNNSL